MGRGPCPPRGKPMQRWLRRRFRQPFFWWGKKGEIQFRWSVYPPEYEFRETHPHLWIADASLTRRVKNSCAVAEVSPISSRSSMGYLVARELRATKYFMELRLEIGPTLATAHAVFTFRVRDASEIGNVCAAYGLAASLFGSSRTTSATIHSSQIRFLRTTFRRT
jgi:hypothetical protein